MLVDTKYKQPYRHIDGLYSVAAEERNQKRRRRAKVRKIATWTLCIGGVAGLTALMHAVTVIRNGCDGIGGEIFIPIGALLAYMVYKQVKRDEKRRAERIQYLEAKRREIALNEFREYDRLKSAVYERRQDYV